MLAVQRGGDKTLPEGGLRFLASAVSQASVQVPSLLAEQDPRMRAQVHRSLSLRAHSTIAFEQI
jgi:hypothetical protein